MRRFLGLFSSLAVAAVLLAAAAHAQPRTFPEGTVRVTLVDGTHVVGTVVQEDNESVELVTEGGIRMTIPRTQIRSVVSVAGRSFHREDPNRSRLFFAPTGRAVEAGRGYVAAYELFFPFVAYGPGSGVTLAGGISLIPGLSGQLVYAAPKVSFYEAERASLAGGVLAGTVLGGDVDDLPTFGLLYGVGTFGGPRAALTAGLAFGFADGEFGKNPALMLGGEVQLSNNVKLLTENYVLVNVDEGVVVSGGIRFFGERLATDLGLITVPAVLDDAEGFPFFPWLGFAYNFGN